MKVEIMLAPNQVRALTAGELEEGQLARSPAGPFVVRVERGYLLFLASLLLVPLSLCTELYTPLPKGTSIKLTSEV